MSYDILLVPRRPGQSWDAALDEAEGRDVLTDPVGPERLAQWERVVESLRRRLGDVELRLDDDVCEATHDSGLQVSLYPDEASITFPYAERADRSAFHDAVVDVVGIVERETGLHAWDAQTDEPFDGQVHDEAGLDAARRIAQEAPDAGATEAMADRAAAGHVGPGTGPPDPDVLPTTGSTSTTGTGATGTAGTTGTTDLELAAQRRRALRYLAIGAVVVVGALLLRSRGEPSTLSGVALALGVADIVIGVLLYRGWARRSASARGAGEPGRPEQAER